MLFSSCHPERSAAGAQSKDLTHCPVGQDDRKGTFWALLLLGLAAFLFSSPARAEDFVFSPQGCDFKMTFPDEPHPVRRCHSELPDQCEVMTAYTQVFDLDATMNFYVTCKSAGEGSRDQYTQDLLRTALLARPGVKTLEVYNTDYQDTPDGLIGILLGAGPSPSGKDAMVYVAQLMIGDSSVFSLEAELIGQKGDEADEAFAAILHSIVPVAPKAPPETPEAEAPQK